MTVFMVYITLQWIYNIVTTSKELFVAPVYFENIFLECVLELTMITLKMSVNYNDNAFLPDWFQSKDFHMQAQTCWDHVWSENVLCRFYEKSHTTSACSLVCSYVTTTLKVGFVCSFVSVMAIISGRREIS